RNYEISNFAKPGGECLHNLGYWNMEPYLGIGPGAVSTLPGKGGTVLRLSNPPHIDTFLEGRQHTWGMKVTPLSRGEFLFENLMMGFRLSKGIRQVTFRKRFESDLAQALGGLWSEWTARGLVLKRPGRYALSRRGRMILNRLLLEIQERVPREQWESGRCRWP
ncbi:MAG TPA: hypothetical protein VMX75_12960, partial [Spirochaetia bacterium]|nr:hypothetical protein [Spirochaetia bacterium]